MRSIGLILCLLCSAPFLIAQETSDFGITLSGFLKTDIFFDTHESSMLREGHFLLYPVKDKIDDNGAIVNDNTAFNILSVQARLVGKITTPDIFGAKTTGYIEGSFFGNTDGDINGFRLRHAYTKLVWESTALLIGQYWHPLLIADSSPEVISFNTGAPFQPVSRNPQIRILQRFGSFSIAGTIASQRDFCSAGPDPGDYTKTVSNSSFLRNSSIPILNCTVKYTGTDVLLGGGINYTQIKPRLVTEKNFKTDETVSSIALELFAKVVVDKFSVKWEGIYGQNMHDLVTIGGYGVTSRDSVTGAAEYTNLSVFTTWAEVIYGSDWKAGLFVGYIKNLGASEDITGQIYARGSDIDYAFRISPRVTYSEENMMFAAEYELTAAAYGTTTKTGTVENASLVNNNRILLAAYLFF